MTLGHTGSWRRSVWRESKDGSAWSWTSISGPEVLLPEEGVRVFTE